MNMSKLIDITGKAISGEWGTDDNNGIGIPVLRTTNFTNDGNVNYNDVVTRIIEKNNISEKFLRYGDIIIEKSGGSDKQPVGRVIYFEGEENTYLFNNFTGLLRVKDKEKWFSKYVFYALFANYQKGGTRRFENKTTGLHNLKTDNYVSFFEVKDIDISRQMKICKQLDSIKNVIQLRKQQLQKLDELVKARFVELFGERLEKETVKLSTLTDVITKGTTPTTLGFEFTESGINFVKIECITEDSKFIVSKMLHISDECNQKLKRSILQENDILFSIAGAIGRTAIVTKEILPANTNQAVAIIRLKANCGLNVKFLNQMLHSSLIEKQVNVKKAGVAQINLSLADIGDFNVIVPPIEEQEQFAVFVEQTDKSKFAVQKALDEAQTLFDSLMQEYFG